MLSLQSTQQLLRALGTHHLSLCMMNRSDYLLMLLWEVRVGDLLILTLYSTSSRLSKRPRIISSKPKSIRSATLTSTTVCRSIKWEKKCCSCWGHFTWLALGSFGLGLLDLSGYWSLLGRQLTGWISGEIQRYSQCLSHLLASQAHPWRLICKSTRANPIRRCRTLWIWGLATAQKQRQL